MRLENLSLENIGNTAYCYHRLPSPIEVKEFTYFLKEKGFEPTPYGLTSFHLRARSEKLIPDWMSAVSHLTTDIRVRAIQGKKTVAILIGPTEDIPVFIFSLILETLMPICSGVVILGHLPQCKDELEAREYVLRNGIPIEFLV